MKTLIQQLQDGEIAIRNNGSKDDLKKIIYKVFNERQCIIGAHEYYFKDIRGSDKNIWNCSYKTNLPSYPIENFIKELNDQTTQSMRTITSQQAQSIIDIACSGWKPRLAKNWAFDIALKNNIEISEESYQEMRKACTEGQNTLFDKIFGKDEPEIKKDDWVYFLKEFDGRNIGDIKQITKVIIEGNEITEKAREIWLCYEGGGFRCGGNGYSINKDFRLATPEEIEKAQYYPDGTPCLVRDNSTDGWYFRYADGQGRFYAQSKKSGGTNGWKQHIRLDINNLPTD